MAKGWHTFQGELLYQYIRLISHTAKYKSEGAAYVKEAMQSGRPVLFTMWHGVMMPFFQFGYRDLDVSRFVVITTGDERAVTLARMGYRLGTKTMVAVDMGGNPVKSGRSVLNVIKAMRGGNYSVLAPDGPDGPAFEPKRGITFLAKKANAVVVPFGSWSRFAFNVPRWDRYLMPFPFSSIQLVFGKPIYAGKEWESAELEAVIVEAIHAARNRARFLTGVL